MLKEQKGFTLIEILIAVAIVGILASIAYPNYTDSVKKSRRTEAKEALLRSAALQEQYYIAHSQYTTDMSLVGGTSTENGYYTLSASFVAGSNDCSAVGRQDCFTITATPVASLSQASDTDCTSLTLDNYGRKAATGNASDRCW